MFELLTSCLEMLSADHLLEKAFPLGETLQRAFFSGSKSSRQCDCITMLVLVAHQWCKYKTGVLCGIRKGPLSF